MDINDVIFPIVAFPKDGFLHFARNPNDIIKCSRGGLKNGFYNSLKIIDSKGNLHTVKEAKKVGTVGPFWGFTIFFNQKLEVELIFSPKSTEVSLEDLKVKILKNFKKNKYYWDSDGELEERIAFVKKATTHREIISRLTEKFYNNAVSLK